jgi:hypothetical protein
VFLFSGAYNAITRDYVGALICLGLLLIALSLPKIKQRRVV